MNFHIYKEIPSQKGSLRIRGIVCLWNIFAMGFLIYSLDIKELDFLGEMGQKLKPSNFKQKYNEALGPTRVSLP